ncbi:LCP family protein [Nocardia vaccinii]|uniref:LCP family protein n=1 Tax=Nocardia vaccinii TaxID=1822 RepID=UPI00082D5890|nr:LCP family protein [Nocardia vaccinii]
MGDDDQSGDPPHPVGRAPWERPGAARTARGRPIAAGDATEAWYATYLPDPNPRLHIGDANSDTRPDTGVSSRALASRYSGPGNSIAVQPSTRPDSGVPDVVTDPVLESGASSGESVTAPSDADPKARAESSQDAENSRTGPRTDDAPVPDLGRAGLAAAPETLGARPFSRRSRTGDRRDRCGRRLRIAGRTLTALAAVATLVLTGAGWNYLRATDKGFTKVQALDVGSHDIVDPVGQLGDENFLIAGTDSRAGANSSVGAGTTADAEGARSDTVMLVNIPASRKRVVVVSFPRDLDVTRPVCAGWNNDRAQYTDTNYPSALGDKLNGVYALGGPRCLIKVIQKLSGLKINHFVGLDFTGFESMVDTVGGVEVCTETPLVDTELGTVLSNPGRQVINGVTALDYVRARHVIGEERSDYDRIHRQQLFLSSLLRSALSNRVLFDPVKLNRFIAAFTSHAFMDNVDTQDLLMLGRSLQKVAAGAITFLTVPTAGTTSYGNEIPRESDIESIFSAIIDDEPLPGERHAPDPAPVSAASAPPQLTAVDPTTVSVQVSNASGVSGTASATATKLAAPGFQIYRVDTYPRGKLSSTLVRYSSGHRDEAATVAAALPGAKLQVTSDLGSIVQVVLGTNFTGAVRTPPTFGTPLPTIASTPPDGSGPANSATLPSDLEHVNAADDNCR